jgi:tetratricopeptide (TPR) repeat protein
MKKYIFVFIASWVAVFYSQNYNKIDDLKKELTKANTDSARVYLMNAIAFNYFETNSDSALYYTQQALHLAKKEYYLKGEARSLMNLGLVFRNLGNLPKSLELQFNALKIFENIGNKKDMASAYTNIAFAYSEHGDYSQAIMYQLKSYEIDKELKLDQFLIIDYHNLGDGYEKIDKLDSALHFENKAYEIALQEKYEDYLSSILINLGNIHLKLGNYDLALPFYRKSSYYGYKFNNYIDICYSYFGMVNLFEKTGQRDSSILYADKAFSEARKGNLSLEMFTASTYLSNFYENVNTDSTLKYLRLSVVLKDSLFNQEKIKQLQNLTFAEKIRQQEISEVKAQEELKQRKTLQMFAIAVFVVIFISLIFVFSRLIINIRVIEWLVILSLLLTFNFISMLLHLVIKSNTYMPVFSFISVAIISLLLRPINHWVSAWMKEKLIRKNRLSEIEKLNS